MDPKTITSHGKIKGEYDKKKVKKKIRHIRNKKINNADGNRQPSKG